MQPVAKRAFTLREVAKMVGRSYYTIHRMVLEGKIKVIQGFGVRMVSDKELERFLGQSETREPNPNRVNAQLKLQGGAQ
ncbi:MAG TPA: helix-turn-helix domain-containing protein [Chthoniobacterales bacterium]|nr:helix-turn-helix domain-containing protein [Chthoniobacterales bacterium]